MKAHQASPDPAALLARIERFRHASTGGGTVSSTMFADEELRSLEIEGKKAIGELHDQSGETGASAS